MWFYHLVYKVVISIHLVTASSIELGGPLMYTIDVVCQIGQRIIINTIQNVGFKHANLIYRVQVSPLVEIGLFLRIGSSAQIAKFSHVPERVQ